MEIKMQLSRRTISYFSNKTLLLQFGLISLLLFVWLPLPFFNFDEHHDGLILSTVRLTKNALITGGDYPFNQYGPFWTIPFLLVSFLVPEPLLFLGIRFLTVIFYFASGYILWKIARLFLAQKLALLVVILFLGSQPFVSDYGSDLVPWPSAVVMPVVLAIAYFSILQVTDSNPKVVISRTPFYVGILIPMVILTRLQVGVLLLAISALTLYFSKENRKILKFASGFALSSLFLCVYLFQLGWLNDAFYDQIIFGSTYLSADRSTFPVPIFTLAGVALFYLLLLAGSKASNMLAKVNLKIILLVLFGLSVLISISLSYLVYSRSISPLSSFVVFTRRFWITTTLASMLFLTMNLMFSIVKAKKANGLSVKFPVALRLLILFALAFQSQIYPLFDQMHFWWGAPLTFLVSVIVFKEYFGTFYTMLVKRAALKVVATVLLLASILIPWTAQISAVKQALPTAIGERIYAVPNNAQYQLDLQKFFYKNIKVGSKVLNLCDNTNVFFKDNQYLPASRFFVFWGEQMSHAPAIIRSFMDSYPDSVVTCGLTHAPALRVKQEELQQRILASVLKKPIDPIVYSNNPQKEWRIYTIEK